MTGPMFTDGTLLDESNEAKRRRIARVRDLRQIVESELMWPRRVICVGRRRLNAMERCLLVHIVSTTRQNVFSHRWRRREILLRGMQML